GVPALPGAIDAVSFRIYVERMLMPALEPGRIVMMDNLSSHKVSGAAEAEDAGGELWYLPPYSPDLNPIEKLWSKVKAWVRQAAARSWSRRWARPRGRSASTSAATTSGAADTLH